MTLENQVTSLELSKRLRELGVRQESHFIWSNYNFEDEVGAFVGFDKGVDRWVISTSEEDEGISAFTASELGEILPVEFHDDDLEKFSMRIWKDYDGQWFVVYFDSAGDYKMIEFGTLADAMAKMLIHLLENKLITLPSM